MLTGLYVSAAGLQAQEYRQSVTTNNLANAQTTGFKRDLALVQARANAALEDPAMAQYRWPAGMLAKMNGGVYAAPTFTDLSQGNLTHTDQPTDVALQGPGFFLVQGDKPSERFLTRDGKFLVRSDGQLVMAGNGKSVLNADGEPIKLNSNYPFEIDEKGEIRQGGNIVSQLAVMTVQNPGDVQKVGANLLSLTNGARATPATTATSVHQNYLEQSGVDPITEMTTMMETTRMFEANAKMIQYQDSTLQSLNTVGKIA